MFTLWSLLCVLVVRMIVGLVNSLREHQEICSPLLPRCANALLADSQTPSSYPFPPAASRS